MSPQKWNVWLVITAQGWAVPGESTGVVLLPLLVPQCLLPTPSCAASPSTKSYLGTPPPPPFSVSDPLCQPLIPCAISHHGLSPRWTGLALSQREKKGQWSQDEPHRDQQNLQEAHGSAGPFSPLSSKIPPSCNSHPLIMCRLQTR